MNRTEELIKYLRAQGGAATLMVSPGVPSLLLAPKAPPVTRHGNEMGIALPMVLDAEDIRDTLEGLMMRVAGQTSSRIKTSGRFAFGMPELGRLRITYATQRGSIVMGITLVPFTIPTLETICENSQDLERVADELTSAKASLVLISGTRAPCNAMVAYGLLQRVNEGSRKVIYIVERLLTYLFPHGDSIVIQSELESDVPTLEEGMQTALLFRPDIVFLGDLRMSDDVPTLSHIVSSSLTTLITSESPSSHLLNYKHMPVGMAGAEEQTDRNQYAIRVKPADDGRVSVEVRGLRKPL